MRFRRLLLSLVPLVVAIMLLMPAEASSVAYLNYTEDYVDSTSDLHAPSDIGTHNVFADLQDYGTNYDTMQEQNTGAIGANYQDFVDATSNLRAPTDVGTHDVFADLQDYGSNIDTMTEANVPVATQVQYQASGTGSATITTSCTPAYPASPSAGDLFIGIVMILDTTTAPSSFTGFTSLLGPYTSGTDGRIWIYYRYSTGSESGTTTVSRASGATGFFAVIHSFRYVHQTIGSAYEAVNWFDLGSVSTCADTIVTTTGTKELAVNLVFNGEDTNTYVSFTSEAGGDWTESVAQFSNGAGNDGTIQLQCATMAAAGTINGGTYAIGGPDPLAVFGFALKPATDNNYRLDLEVGWSAAEYSETNEELSIYTSTQNAEALMVDIWTGSWTNVIADLTADTWNNVSISAYLTDATVEIRFIDATQSSDISQSSWLIDAVLLHCWTVGSTNYQLDLEVGWTAADYQETEAYLCIYPVTSGGWPDEDILVKIWSGSWTTLTNDLTPDQWNNISISTYFTDATAEVQFIGGSEISDTTQDTWTIDAVLIKTYSYIYTETVNETLSLADSTEVSMTASLQYFETISLTDVVNAAASFSTIISELISISASVGVAASLVLNLFEQVAVSETITVSALFIITLVESISLGAFTEASKFVVLSLFETISIGGVVTTACYFSTVLNEIVTLTAVTIVPGTSILYKIIIYEVVNIYAAIPILTSYRPSVFYDLFLSLEMWGYLGPLALVIIGYFITKKERGLGIFFIIVDSLIIATYLTLVEATPQYWWHIFILILGVIQCTFRLASR